MTGDIMRMQRKFLMNFIRNKRRIWEKDMKTL